jgi:hypothetical protein
MDKRDKNYGADTSENPPHGQGRESQVVALEDSLIIRLTPEHKEEMQRCLKRSGKVRFRFAELSLTELPSIGSKAVVDAVD